MSALGAPKVEPNLVTAFEAAAQGDRLMFVLRGTPTCVYGKATRAMIHSQKITLPTSKFVVVDVDCSQVAGVEEFTKYFGKAEFPDKTPPHVVIADSHAKIFEVTAGPKDAAAWQKVIQSAQAKARAANRNEGGQRTG